jgi:glycosyltransferase involved in cell wall biosynthesis
MRRRIAFVTHFCPHYRRRLFEKIAERTEADFIFFAEDSPQGHWNHRIPVTRDGSFRRVELRRVRFPRNQVLTLGLALMLSRSRYDAVVKCLNGKLMVPFVMIVSRLRGLPVVVWTGMWHHPVTRFHRYTRWLTNAVYRHADAIVVYGEHVKRALVAVPGVDSDKIFIAGQAVEPGPFEAIRAQLNGSSPPTLLYIGQFKDCKGLFDLLEAFMSIEDPDARLRLAGNGVLEAELRSRAAEDPRIQILGYIPPEQMPAQFLSTRCLVLPSITTRLERETWGLVVNEAMHAGIPVIATDAVGAAAGGLVRDGSNGFVVPERDPRALAAAMRRLIDDPGLARALGQQASADVARFTHAAMAEAFVEAIEYAIASRAPNGG